MAWMKGELKCPSLKKRNKDRGGEGGELEGERGQGGGEEIFSLHP